MAYTPEIAPKGELQRYLQREFDKISNEFKDARVSSIVFELNTTVPSKPVEGMLKNFSQSVHGIAGLYQYVGGVWTRL